MTDETKKLFDAPWVASDDKDDPFPFMHHKEIVSNNGQGHTIAKDIIGDDANRLARLPELYDALVYFVHRSCSSAKIDRCPNKGAGWIGCRDCSLMPYIELLRKVRDGE